MVQLARSGLDLIISWCFHLQGKIDWESSSRVQGELGDIRVSVPLGPWHLFVIVTQPLLDPPSVLLQDRSGFLPQMWTWGQPLSLQQLCSVSSCLPHKFQLTERRENVQSTTVGNFWWTCQGFIQFNFFFSLNCTTSNRDPTVQNCMLYVGMVVIMNSNIVRSDSDHFYIMKKTRKRKWLLLVWQSFTVFHSKHLRNALFFSFFFSCHQCELFLFSQYFLTSTLQNETMHVLSEWNNKLGWLTLHLVTILPKCFLRTNWTDCTHQ